MIESPFEDLLLGVPSDGNVLPHVTPAIVADALSDLNPSLDGSPAHRRIFRWFEAVNPERLPHLEGCAVPVSQLLLAAEAHDVPEMSKRLPDAFFLACVRSPAEAEALKDCRKRVLAVEVDGQSDRILLRLQNLFLRQLLWENDLTSTILKGGTLDSMLDTSVPILQNFIFVSDNDFNVIASTSGIEPPDELHRTIVSNGCLTSATISEKRFRLPEKTFYTRSPSDVCPYSRVSYPIHLNHTYYGSVSMVCNERPDTQGLRDLFSILVRHIKTVCNRLWVQQAAYGLPSYFFFERLLRGESMTDEYLRAQVESNGMPLDGMLKVLVFDIDPSIEPAASYRLTRVAAKMNEGQCKCFPYQHHVIALCYSDGSEGSLSHRRTVEDLEEFVRPEVDVACGVSSVFSGIQNMNNAYKQALTAIGFKESIDLETEDLATDRPTGVYFFEDALLYYLIDPAPKDVRFMDFALNKSIVQILHKEDLENGTAHVKLLWHYLQSERNATLTAQQLHMHRNTVLYHIDKLEKRFDFDMDVKTVRDWLLLHFKALFASISHESLATIFPEETL